MSYAVEPLGVVEVCGFSGIKEDEATLVRPFREAWYPGRVVSAFLPEFLLKGQGY